MNKKFGYNTLRAQQSQLIGFRKCFVIPGDGSYSGEWKDNKQEGSGNKTEVNGVVYEGQWKQGMRNGQGTLRKVLPNGGSQRIYVGEWKNGKKHGEGKKFYKNGVYFGWWKANQRNGLGIMWYNDGSTYIGEWKDDNYSGSGVLYQANGNRYEGLFVDGKKHGEGLFYHIQTGQVQKGVWEEGNCKTSIMLDEEFREKASEPTACPIPKSEVEDPDKLVHDMFRMYLPSLPKNLNALKGHPCLNLVKQVKKKFQNLRQ